MSLSSAEKIIKRFEELTKNQAEKIDHLETRIKELEAEVKASLVENVALKEKLGINSKVSVYLSPSFIHFNNVRYFSL